MVYTFNVSLTPNLPRCGWEECQVGYKKLSLKIRSPLFSHSSPSSLSANELMGGGSNIRGSLSRDEDSLEGFSSPRLFFFFYGHQDFVNRLINGVIKVNRTKFLSLQASLTFWDKHNKGPEDWI